MLARMLAFAGGIYTVLQFPVLPPQALLALFPFCICIAWRYPAIRLPMCFVAGCCWMIFRGHLYIADVLPQELEQQDIMVEGKVLSMPQHFEHYQRFEFHITHRITHENAKQSFPLRSRLSWYKNNQQILPGQIWRFSIRLKRPHGFMNPGGFDYEAWLLRKEIRALGYVRDSQPVELIRSGQGSYTERVRLFIAEKIKTVLSRDYQGLVLALSLGDRSLLTPTQRQQLNHTGTSHLIAISGLHLGLVAMFAFYLARFGWSRSLRLTNILPAPFFATAFAFLIALIYALLAGFTLPTQRALIMIGMVLFSLTYKRPVQMSRALLIAAFLILLIDPLALLAADFWLSFAAVVFILYLVQGRKNAYSQSRRWLHLQVTLSLALFPLLIVWFNQVPVYSVFANLLTIPLVGLAVVPLALLAMLVLLIHPTSALEIYQFIYYLIDFFWWYLTQLQRLPGNIIAIPGPSPLALLCGLIGMALLFMPRGLPARWLGSIFLLPLFFPTLVSLQHGEFDFELLDVGQGLAAALKTENHSLLFDTGARFSERFNMGEAVIIPYYRFKGVNSLDMLIVSHADNDHIGGALPIIAALKPARILTSEPDKLNPGDAQPCRAGQAWDWDGVRFEMLHPDDSLLISNNNRSCVLKVSSAFGSVLLTGDIEKQAEIKLVQQNRAKLKADVLIVPHHGSRTSSTPPFIDAVAPDYAFFPVGYKNRFGFPKQDILSRYIERDIETRGSDQSGSLLVSFRKNGMLMREYRHEKQRFWHDNVLQDGELNLNE